MAEAVVSFVLQSVRDFTTQEAKFLSGVSQQVEVAQTELQLMHGFLKDADRRQVDDASVRIWVAKIRDAAYDLEDVIQTYGLKVATKNKGGMKNVLKRCGSIFKQWVDLHKIGAEIENITVKISNLRSSLQSYNIIRETREIGGASSLHSFERQQQLRRTYSHVIERVVVGIKDNVKEIVTYLVKEENCLRVVSIWGMGGSGKTTLAKQIYHHEEVSRELFEKIAISGRIGEDSGVYKKMKELGIEMLRHCAGLPLAIIVLAGVLARKNNVKEWGQCMRMFMNALGEANFMNKNMKTEEESFLQIGHSLHENESTNMFTSSMVPKATPLGKVRRLAIYLDENADRLVSSRGETSGHLRSLLYYDLREWRPTSKKLLLSPLTGFKVLRILKLEGVNEKVEVVELPSEIGSMVHLRFLSVRSSNINTFPSSLGNLICLQTLDFRVKNDLNIPNVIWKMKELEHLYLPMFYRAGVELKPSTLGHLQTLDFLPSKYCDLKDVIGLTNIRKLNIQLSSSLENLEEILKSTGSTFNRIRSLFVDIDYARKSSYEEQIRQIVSICQRIYKLKLFGPTPELPKELCNYANLTKLELRSCGLKDDQMGILEKLPHLTTLRLQGRNTFDENTKILVFSKGGFLCLEFLSVFDIPEITEWRVEEGAMPSLCRLRIGFPCGLTTLPHGLRYLTNLRKLSIFRMPREFHSMIQEDGEDFSKIQHVPSLVIGEPYDPPIQ
ncbi:hypothetical protein L3X38_000972 [Prunus dulcis]|uniref:NB-ARC domain-containing disease resistance protein n=1 Tax=Prunus dulcis TaxID=3755 RepID=A0AAD4ZJE5_PRUDU|nr:hypothetical protein L3X38_000972 [Prunus dulcis]